jgi:solute carrier family 25 oxoglutarate transporter 11
MSYFEFEDVKRFHQPYEDQLIRGPYWKPAHDNSLWINFKTAMYPSFLIAAVYEPARHFVFGAKTLNGYYEWPRTNSERNIFFREVFRLPNFWSDMAKKMTFGFVHYAGDVGVKMTAWRYVYGSTSSPVEYADWNAFKLLICAQLAFIPTCWTAIPFEMASRSYYADKTWPVELRRGYRSPLNALLRIPFEEGPAHLFRGGLPI